MSPLPIPVPTSSSPAPAFEDPAPTPLALLLLGRQSDASSERGVECPGDLPLPSDPDLVERARRAKDALGERVFVLGHHYQRDEVIQFADVTGDSFKRVRTPSTSCSAASTLWPSPPTS
jgi:quinolinate synthase